MAWGYTLVCRVLIFYGAGVSWLFRAKVRLLIVALVCVNASNGASQNVEPCPAQSPPTSDEFLRGQGWECSAERDEPRVCSRAVAGVEIREVLVMAVMTAQPTSVYSVIADYARYPQFMPYVEKSEILKTEEDVVVVFQQLDFPWPISDRYYTIRLSADTRCAAQGMYQVRWSLAPDSATLHTGEGEPLRVNTGSWSLRPVDAGQRTEVTYFVHTDPGGALPVWVINLANKVAAPKVIEAVRLRASASETP